MNAAVEYSSPASNTITMSFSGTISPDHHRSFVFRKVIISNKHL